MLSVNYMHVIFGELHAYRCTMCKIAHFARKMGGQNFNKFNAVLTSGDYI